MPCIEIYTNLLEERVPDDFYSDLTEYFCDLLDKWPKAVVVSIYPNQKISLGKNLKEECVVVQIYNAEAFLDAKDNKEFIKNVTDKLVAKLKIKKERTSIMLLPLTSHTVCTPWGLLADWDEFKWRHKYLENLKTEN